MEGVVLDLDLVGRVFEVEGSSSSNNNNNSQYFSLLEGFAGPEEEIS